MKYGEYNLVFANIYTQITNMSKVRDYFIIVFFFFSMMFHPILAAK